MDGIRKGSFLAIAIVALTLVSVLRVSGFSWFAALGVGVLAWICACFFYMYSLATKSDETMRQLAAEAREEDARVIEIQKQKFLKAYDYIEVTAINYIETLARKRRTLVRTGDYGETIDDAWRAEIIKFLNVTCSQQLEELVDGDPELLANLVDFVDTFVCGNDPGLPLIASADVVALSGHEYEAYCAELLEINGWHVHRTPLSCDQGVDLIAEKDGRRVAIQCKRYSAPVGNKSVQEAYSGMAYVEAGEAVVVSNTSFTTAAITLANKLSVVLLHHDDLAAL